MDTKYLRGNDGSDRKTVENIDKGFPRFDVTPPFTFIVKTVDCNAKSEKRSNPNNLVVYLWSRWRIRDYLEVKRNSQDT